MLSVIIVEDEHRICRMLKKMIETANIGYKVVDICTDGISGIERIKELQPDVVITDIRMSGCSGIDMIAEVVPTNPNIDFVVISGYKYFENAYRAIQLGIKYYLLKPIEEEELIRILNNIKELRSSEAIKTKHSLELQNQVIIQQNCLRDNFVIELFHRNLPSQIDIAYANSHYQCNFCEGFFQAFLIKIDSYESNEIKEENLLYQKMIGIVEKSFEQHVLEIVCSIQEGFLVCILNFNQYEQNIIGTKLFSTLLENSKLQIQNFGPYAVSIGVGMAKDRINFLSESFEEARIAVRSRLINGTMRIINFYEPPKYHENIPNMVSPTAKTRLLNLVQSGDVAGIKIWVKEQEGVLTAALKIDISCLFDLCIYISKMLVAFFWEKLNIDFPNTTTEFEFHLESAPTTEVIYKLLAEHIITLSNLYIQNFKSKDPIIIQEAKNYIQSNFALPLKLEDVAQEVHLSPTYFSGLFKQTTGATFIDYLTHVRIDNAKRLLRSTKASIPDIAISCGYSDDKYFAQLFRKNVGLRPAAYRKLYL